MLVIAPPNSSRQLLNLFMLFKEVEGVDSVLSQIDFAKADRRQIIYAAFGRPPDRQELMHDAYFTARTYLSEILHSPEFQRGIIEFILRALPEKRRLIFIHIPKCAGTDLIAHLSAQFPSINYTLTAFDWTSKEQLFAQLRDIAILSNFSDDVFVGGHFNLQFFLQSALLRYTDRCFTIVRDPASIIISQLNYIMTRFIDDPEQKLPDTREWLKLMNIERIPDQANDCYFRSLASQLLRKQSMIRRNYLCTALGRGTARTALDNLQTSNIEITDTTKYDDWVKEAWGVTATTRRNESKKIVTETNIDAKERDYIASITREDRPLYDMIMNKLAASSAGSIRGSELCGGHA
jgi:hypothetical protein